MAKKVMKILFHRDIGANIVKCSNLFFNCHSGALYIKVSYEEILKDINHFMKKFLSFGICRIEIDLRTFLDFTKDNVIKAMNDEKDFNYIVLEKGFNLKEVQEFFNFYVSIQINGKEIEDFIPLSKGRKCIDEDIITFISYVGNENGQFGKLGATADTLFGPRYKTECDLYLTEDRVSEEYRRHISEIEKIFITKEFRDAKNIGTDKEYELNGKIERLELDLRHPDMNVYEKIRAIDNCIEIEWE